MRNCVMIKLRWVEFRVGYLDAVLSTTGRRCLGKIFVSWREVIWPEHTVVVILVTSCFV